MNKTKNIIRVLVVVALIVILFVAMREANIKKSSSTLTITGIYGTEVPMDEITSLELRDSIPKITRRNNGIGIGGLQKGYFSIEEFDKARLILHTNEGPYLIIQTEKENIIVNFRDPEKTRMEFESVQGYLDN